MLDLTTTVHSTMFYWKTAVGLMMTVDLTRTSELSLTVGPVDRSKTPAIHLMWILELMVIHGCEKAFC
jgi:hypothetical protein